MNTSQAQRIIIFGREGIAREQLVSALSDHGVVPIWVGNPVQSNPNELSVLNPNQIIISLDPFIEVELLPYNDFLRHSDINILYDDAESTRHLSGWDLNRWARHMASKLLKIDYMPPAPKTLDSTNEANQSNSDELSSESTISNELSDVAQLINAIPTSNEFKVVSTENEKSFDWQNSESFDTLDINSSELAEALSKIDKNLSSDSDGSELHEQEYDQLIPISDTDISNFESKGEGNNEITADIDFDFGTTNLGLSKTLDLESQELNTNVFDEIESAKTTNNFELLLEETTDQPTTFNILEQAEDTVDENLSYMDEEALKQAVSKLDSQLFATNTSLETISTEIDSLDSTVNADNVTEDVEDTAKPREFDLSKYSLVNEEDEQKILAMENEEARNQTSLFMIISGVGGPGVLRTILGHIDKSFSSIVVISQTIEAVQLFKLSQQLQKVVDVPVNLLESDEFLKDGNIYLLPEKHSIIQTSLGYQCITGNSMASFIAESKQDIEFVILSGADKSLADVLIETNKANKNVHVQPADECFDAKLPQLLINTGVPVLRQYILEKWFN